jgi:hypothetical protein
MNTVTVSGWLQADPVIERLGDQAVCELRLALERPGPDRRRTSEIAVTCLPPARRARVERLAGGDQVGVTWPPDRRGR